MEVAVKNVEVLFKNMDPLKLLSRSARRTHTSTSARDAPSSGQHGTPQLFPETTLTISNGSRKRKRNHEIVAAAAADKAVSFFGKQEDVKHGRRVNGRQKARDAQDDGKGHGVEGAGSYRQETVTEMPIEDCRRILKEHKLKVTWLNPTRRHKKARQQAEKAGLASKKTKDSLAPQPLLAFEELSIRYGLGDQIARNLAEQSYNTATEVQIAALPLLMDNQKSFIPTSGDERSDSDAVGGAIDLLSVAPTGSGKTLAFLIPLLHRLRQDRRKDADAPRYTSAVILAPTKELSSQIVNEARKLAKGTGIKITQMRKGMLFAEEKNRPDDGDSEADEDDADPKRRSGTVVKADIVVSAPGLLQSALRPSAESTQLSMVRYVVLDEADVLLDPLFKTQTLDVWNGLTHPSLRVSMWSATMGSNIEELAKSTIVARHRKLQQEDATEISEAPLIRLIVGLKDSAAPNVEHKLIYAASEQGKLMGLRQLLHPTSSSDEAGPLLRPPFLVFTQTIERAVALHAELRYDVPAEAGGISRIQVLHAKLSATARESVMTRFRNGSIWVLITTDLLSRGVDFRGVNGVVNYDIPGSSAAYIHRIGRTGRAGREGGIAVTLYSKDDLPYLKHIANVMTMAQRHRGEIASETQQWLHDALPKLSKNEKQDLKKHGVKARTAGGKASANRAGKSARISTKAGFARQAEHRRKGAKAASQRMLRTGSTSEADGGSDFAGFD